MVFRDEMLVCQECCKTFIYTVTEQRRQADQVGEDGMVAPELCPACRTPQPAFSSAQPEPAEHIELPDLVEPVAQAEPIEDREPDRRAQREPRERRAQRAPDRAAERPTPVLEMDDFPLEEEGIELKLIGAVKWFNRNKGYGFVTMADGQDVFFHRSDIVGVHLSQIKDGMQVEFQVRRTDKGIEAFNVSPLPPR